RISLLLLPFPIVVQRKFDVRIKDVDEVNFLDLVDEMIDEAMKQDVFLPRLWRMFYEYPSLLDSGRRVEIVDDRSLVSMFPEFIYEDEVKVFIEEAASVGVRFKLAVEKREARLRAEALKQKELQKAMEEERKRVEEERKRIEEEEKIEREIEEAKKYTVAIEVPIVNVDGMNVEFQRVFSSPAVFPGFSQPPVTQESELSDSELPHGVVQKTNPAASEEKTPPHKKPAQQKHSAAQQTSPSSTSNKKAAQQKTTPPSASKKKPAQQKTTPSKQKTSPTQQKTTASQQKTTPPSASKKNPAQPKTMPAQQETTASQQKTSPTQKKPQHPNKKPHQPSRKPQQPSKRRIQPSIRTQQLLNKIGHQPNNNIHHPTKILKERSSSKPFRLAKTSSKREGTYVPKTKGGTRVTTRGRKSIQPQEDPSEDDESPWGSDTSEDDDYVQSDVIDEEDLEDLDLVNEFRDEDDVDAPITSKSFEDCLDGSSCFDQLYKNGTVVGEMEFGEVKLEQWMIFSNKEHFLGTFRDFCIQEGFAVRVEKADNVRFTATCIVQDCDWRIHASRLMDGISRAIKSITSEHKLCGRLEENPMVSSAWLITHLREDITATPDIPLESLQTLCMNRFRVKVKKSLLYKVRVMTKEKMHGGFAESYGLLPAYAEMIKQTNSNSYALITWKATSEDDGPRFKGCFFSFAAQVRGFLKGCRPIIGFDGAHLNGHYKGTLLTAVGIDENNEIFPIAYGIVDNQSIESWSYFFRNLRLLFRGGVEKDDFTFISDRMMGVEAALHEVFPQATRRICSQHLYMNCNTTGYSGGAFQKLFLTAADAYNSYVFKKAMTKIGELDKSAVHYLEKVDEQWSRHAFGPLVCCDHNTTNFVELFNACTKPYRDLPVMTLFDKAIDMEPNALTEFAMKVLEDRRQESGLCYVVFAGGGEFEVRDGHVLFPIKLREGKCLCGVWQGTGIPCKHGLKVIYDQRRRGRFEKKKGKRNSTVKCAKCKQVGHNTRTCKGGANAKQRYSAAPTPSQASQPSQASSSKGRKRKDAAKTSTSKAAQKKTKYAQ
ncbi:Protein FAR1-RELATED SEQUENCE 8, partial [Bienertia sinuspersici]